MIHQVLAGGKVGDLQYYHSCDMLINRWETRLTQLIEFRCGKEKKGPMVEVPPGWYIAGWYTCKKTGKKRPILKRIGS